MRPTILPLEDRQLLATFTLSEWQGTGTNTLPWAIAQANQTPEANTIPFDPSVFSSIHEIDVTAELELTNTDGLQRIIAPAGGLTITANNESRVFEVDADVKASFSGLGIIEGNGRLSDPHPRPDLGGALLNLGTTRLEDCSLSDNAAYSDGAMYNAGTLTLADCTLSGNHAGSGGGLYNRSGATATLDTCTITDGSADQQGAGAFNAGTISPAGCTNTINEAESNGATGGGVFNSGTATFDACTIASNRATAFGGGLHNSGSATLDNCTITGNRAVNQDGGGLEDTGTATTTLGGTILAGSVAPTGIVSITVNGVTVSAAIAADGPFSSTFDTSGLGVPGSPDTITDTYAGGGGFQAARDSSRMLTVTPPTPKVSVSDAGGIDTGSPYPADDHPVRLRRIIDDPARRTAARFRDRLPDHRFHRVGLGV